MSGNLRLTEKTLVVKELMKMLPQTELQSSLRNNIWITGRGHHESLLEKKEMASKTTSTKG